tara:strand:+ start:130 stop:369 length:240 start_codon:yes stop_codon:yes gene_type:complete
MKENEYEIDGVWHQIKPNEMEFIDEIATQLTELNFHENTFVPTPVGLLQLPKFTEEAQDFYNERYDEVESLFINLIKTK